VQFVGVGKQACLFTLSKVLYTISTITLFLGLKKSAARAMSALRLPAATSSSIIWAICALTSPFLLVGLMGVCSVMLLR